MLVAAAVAEADVERPALALAAVQQQMAKLQVALLTKATRALDGVLLLLPRQLPPPNWDPQRRYA